MAARRRKARAMKSAREYCSQLKQCAAEDEFVPVEHLRAAEQHLAQVERWLVAKKIHSIRSNVSPAWHADLLARDVGVPEGDQKDGWEDEFRRCFGPVPHDEMFVTALPCSVLSHHFRYPGKIYITSSRICFVSSVLGIGANFSSRWTQVSKLRLTNNKTVMTYPVRIVLKSFIAFDGAEVSSLDVRIFNYSDLKILHKAAMNLLGSGLFGTWQGTDTRTSEESDDDETAKPVLSPSSPANENEASLVFQQRYAIWELERWSILARAWQAPFALYDGICKQRWVATRPDGTYIPYPYAPQGSEHERFSRSDIPPLERIEFNGQTRSCGWTLEVKDGQTDMEGWQYSDGIFDMFSWKPFCSSFSVVRKRCWIPNFSLAEDVVPLPPKVPTTYIKQKGLGTPQVIFEADVGNVSLEALGKELEADKPWEADAEGGLMAMYFHKIEAYDMDVGAWADGGAAQGVQGKARHLEYRKPLPPKPMCPKESRIHSTCHVVRLPDRVVLEQSVMTLDTPASSCNLWLCDTFTISGGRMKMIRSCGLEWVSSSWIKGILEKEVPNGAREGTPIWLEVIADWAKKSAV